MLGGILPGLQPAHADRQQSYSTGGLLPFKVEPNSNDQHVYVRFPVNAAANSL